MVDNNDNGGFVVGDWHVNPSHLTCTSDGKSVRLQPKHMAVLLELARGAPELVTRSVLIDRVWPRGFVDPNVLNNAVSTLRKKLDPAAGSLIETVPRRGYRLSVPVVSETNRNPARWSGGSPYRGLHPYESTHADVFFGREREVQEILAALRMQAENGRGFTLLIGASGVGKTSLINAGIIPALCASPATEFLADWHVVPVQADATRSPWSLLSDALVQCFANEKRPIDVQVPPGEVLRVDPMAAFDAILSALEDQRSVHDPRILLVLDHLELMLSVSPDSNHSEEFFAAIHEVVRSGRVWAIAALRSDYYPECSRSPALTALRHNHGQYDLAAPDAEQIGRIIRCPAAAAKLTFDTDPESAVRLDDLLQSKALDRTDVLPLLQFTLNELYAHRDNGDTLTYAAFDDLGGLYDSMARRADAIFSGLDNEAKAELPVILSATVRVSGGSERRYSRRFAIVSDLITTPARQRLVDALVDGRLFVTTSVNECPVVSVAHESLFHHWDRASVIIDENHELLAFSRRLSDAANHWEQHSRSENFLLGAGPLGESEKLLSSGTVAVAAGEAELVAASRKRAFRTTALKRTAIGMLVSLAAIASGAAVIADMKQREAEQEAKRASQTMDFIVRLFERANPGAAGGSDISVRQVLDLGAHRLVSEFTEHPESRAELLHSIGSVYLNLGAYDNARPLLEEAASIRLDAGSGAESVAASYNALGKLAYYEGDYDQAAERYALARSVLEDELDSDSAVFALTLNNEAEVEAALGDYDSAADKHRQALQVRQDLFGVESAEVGSSLQNLAGVLRRSGRADEAEPLYRQAIAIQENALGEAHPEVAVALSNLGLLLTDTQRYDEAESLLQRALIIRRESLGTEHRDTANSLHNLSALAFRERDYVRAEPLFRESLALHEKLFGEHHDAVAYGRNNLATLLLDIGQIEEAGELYAKAHASLVAKLGANHPNTALIRANRAKADLAVGNYASARAYLEGALAVLESALPPEHWRLAVIRGNYGAALVGLGEYKSAEEQLLAAWEVLSVSRGQKSETAQRVLADIVDLYENAGRHDQAAKYTAMRVRIGGHQ